MEDITAAEYLRILKQRKCRFFRPQTKAARLPSNLLRTIRVMSENYEKEGGKRVNEAVRKLHAESAGFQAQYAIFEALRKDLVDQKEKKSKSTQQEIENLREQARQIEQGRSRRLQAAVAIQKHVRAKIASRAVDELRRIRRAGWKILQFLRFVIREKKRVSVGLEEFRQHYFASIITDFIRKVGIKLYQERILVKHYDKIKGLLDGIKARTIFGLPRMKETKANIQSISENIESEETDQDTKNGLRDELKYQKNLYLNLFYKFWTKKTSLAEETGEYKAKDKAKKNPVESKIKTIKRLKSTANNDPVKSRISSRRPSQDGSDEDIVNLYRNLEDRPIKPMGEGSIAFSDGTLTPNRSKSRKKPEKEEKKPKEVSEKVLKQRELMEKRKKYDPRKKNQETKPALKESASKDKRAKKNLENIMELVSEDRSINHEENHEGGEAHDGKKFSFLKRKTKKVAENKVDWKNVKGKTDCWGPKGVEAAAPRRKERLAPKQSPRRQSPGRDLNMIKLKGEGAEAEGRRGGRREEAGGEARKKDTLGQIEETLRNNYMVKLEEVFAREVSREPRSTIPVLGEASKFMLYIEENDMKQVLEELEEEYEILVNM
jgi:hypothetical protein